MLKKLPFIMLVWLALLCAPRLALSHEDHDHEHAAHKPRLPSRPSSERTTARLASRQWFDKYVPERKEKKISETKPRKPHTHADSHDAGLRAQLALEYHGALEQTQNRGGSRLEGSDFDFHIGPNYAGAWYELTVFLGLGRSTLSPLSNQLGWSTVFGGEASFVVADPLHITTKLECESGFYRIRTIENGRRVEYAPPFGCALLVGPEIELVRWDSRGRKERGEWSIEFLGGIGGEYERGTWGPAQFRFLIGTHLNF